jgi:hypothetical protein
MSSKIASPVSAKTSQGIVAMPRSPMRMAWSSIIAPCTAPIAFCLSARGQNGLQNACAELTRVLPRLSHIAPQVVAGGALMELSTVAASR